MSKLHHTIAKLERIYFGVCTFHLGIHFSFGYATFWGYTLSIWVYTFYLGMHFIFGYALFIWVCTFHLGVHFLVGYALFIWVCTFYLGKLHTKMKSVYPNEKCIPQNSKNGINKIRSNLGMVWCNFDTNLPP